MKALVGTFNQVKAFSVIVKTAGLFAALIFFQAKCSVPSWSLSRWCRVARSCSSTAACTGNLLDRRNRG